MEDKRISSLGNKIDYLRFLHGDISKKNFCKESGISTSTLNNIENGITPTLDTLVKIADYFDVTVDYLLDRTDIPGPVYKDIDALHLSEGGRYVLESNEIYGKMISHLLENASFRKLLRQMDGYFNDEGMEASLINNKMAEIAMDGLGKYASNTMVSDLESEQVLDSIDSLYSDYDKDKLNKFAHELSDILPEVKSSYHTNPHDRKKMQQLTITLNDVCDEMAQSAKLTKSIKPETYVKTYMDYLKRNKIFGENEQTYTHLGQALILMLRTE